MVAAGQLRVLLVEDSEHDAELIRLKLAESDNLSRFLRVSSLVDLGGALRDGMWDVVVSEFDFEGFTAFDVNSLMRLHDPDMPLIVVSGHLSEETAVPLIKKGAADFVTKSHLSRLPLTISRALRESTQKRMHRQLELSSRTHDELTRRLTEVVDEGILVIDDAGQLVFMNRKAENLLGWCEGELHGLPIQDFVGEAGETEGKGAGFPLLTLLRHGEPAMEERVSLRCKGGECASLFMRSAPVVEDGRIVASVLAIRENAREAGEAGTSEPNGAGRRTNGRANSRTNGRASGAGGPACEQAMPAPIFSSHERRCADLAARVDGLLASMEKGEGNEGEMRAALADLRRELSPMHGGCGLPAALEELSRAWSGRAAISCLSHLPQEADCGEAEAMALYRAAETALNAVAHRSGARHATLALRRLAGEWLLEMADDAGARPGTLADSIAEDMLVARERVLGVGGRFEIETPAQGGMILRCAVPAAGAGAGGADGANGASEKDIMKTV